jgi:site-specific DNA recombinase
VSKVIQHPEKTSAAIYLRVSTDDQAQHGYGIDVQRERSRAQAIAKGWDIVGEYIDEGISGTKDETGRPGLASLLHDCAEQKINAVIVLALDRLGRKTSIVLSLVEKFTALNVALVSCKESLDTSTPQGQFVLTMFAALAQLERDTIVERTTAGRNQRGRRDGERGGRIHYGYDRLPDSSITVVEDEARTVRNIFAWRRLGLTLRAIATQLNDTDRPTPQGASKWYASTVKVILGNEADYRGGTRWESDARWPTILV